MMPAYDFLLQKLDGFIRKYYLNQLVRGSIYLAAVLLISYLVFITLEYFGYFSSTVRGFFFYGFLLLNTTFFVWKILPPLMHFFQLGRRIGYEQASEIIGTHFSDIQDKLLNVLQLRQQMVAGPQQSLIEASINQKIFLLQPVPFNSAIHISENKKYIGWALAPLGLVLAIALTAPAILNDGTQRVINYDRFYAPEAPFRFQLAKNLSATQGDDFTLDVSLSGDEFPDELYLNDGNNTFRLEKKDLGHFRYTFHNVQQDVHFRLTGNEFSSSAFLLKVKRKPEFLSADAELTFPAYIHRKPQHIDNAGDQTIPAGTTIKWTIRTKNTDKISTTPTLKETGSTNGQQFVFSGVFKQSTQLVFSPHNAEAGKSEPASYRISVIPDQSPVINVSEKQDPVSTNTRYFSGQIQDDYGFSRLEFHYSVKRDGEAKPTVYKQNVPFARSGQPSSSFFYDWNFKTLSVQPGDEVTYYFEVWDNDGVNGAKSAKSSTYTLSVPTKNDVQKKLESGAKSVQQKMQTAAQLAGELNKSSQKIQRNLLSKRELGLEEKKQVEDLLNKRRELEELMKEIKQENEKNAFQRNENTEQNNALKEKQKQLDELFDQTLNNETQELLKNIQKLLEQNNIREQTQEQMTRMQTDNKSLQKELDRLKELYKQLAFDQKLNDQTKQLENLAVEQNKLAEQNKQHKQSNRDLKAEQDKLNKQFESVKQGMKELEEQNKPLEQKSPFDPQKKEQQQIEQKMQQSAEDLKNDQEKKALENQQQAAQQLQQMAKKMQQMQQEGASQQLNINISELRQLLDNLVTASFEQEKVMNQLRGTTPDDPAYSQMAQIQKNIQDNLKNVEDSLYSLSRRVPQIQNAVNKETAIINERIKSSLENLGDRQTAEALRDQQYAMTSLNNLALMLNEALDQLQNMTKNAGSSGKSSKPSLSQLQKMQQELNQNMQRAREQMQREGNQGRAKQGQPPGSEQFAQMARRQQQIREALQKVEQSENKGGSRSGDLNKIRQEMEQTEYELVNKKITDEMLRRQGNIQIKMLEAEKARKEKEEEEQRESNAGKDIPPGRQNVLKAFNTEQLKQLEQLRTLTPQITPFYKSKINAYFEHLNKSQP